MFSNLLLISTLAALTTAQSTTISLFIPGADTQSLVGSVIASDATATTYLLQCAPGADECGFPAPFTLTEGPSTAAYTLTGDVSVDSSTALDFSANYQCSLATSSAICSLTASGSAANDPGASTETLTGEDFTFMPVVITAGVLNTAAPSSTPTGVVVSSTPTGSSFGSAGGKTSSGVAKTQGGSSMTTGTSTGGMAMITGAGWVVGGAALAAVLI